MSDPTLRNLNANILGTGEFSFSPGATSLADARAKGFIDFGNVKVLTPQPKIDTIDHKGSYRGKLITDKKFATGALLVYGIVSDEFDRNKYKIAVGGIDATNFTQGAQVAQNGDVLHFDTTAAVIGRWYDLLISGAHAMELTALTIATLVENTDFVVDYKAGRVRFLTAQAVARTPVITANAVVAGNAANLKGITPLDTLITSGYGRIAVYDDTHANKLVYLHEDFSCQVYLDGNGLKGFDGTTINEINLGIQVGNILGTLYTAE